MPILHAVLPAAYLRYGKALESILAEFPDDFGWSPGFQPESMPATYRSGEFTDEWRVVWRNDQEGILGIPVGHPLSDWSRWDTYRLPDPPSEEHFARVHRDIAESGHHSYAIGWGVNIFERMQWLRGYENLMCDLVGESKEAYLLRDAVVEWSLEGLRRSAAAAVDGIGFGDDWGTQQSLIIKPDLWRRFFKPAYAAMFRVCKDAGKHVHFHTDGVTRDIMEDLVEIGCDVLNVQHTIMDLADIAAKFGGRVAFRSDLDRQRILPHGTRDEIRRHVAEVIEALGSYGGGLIGHGEIGPDVPLENVRHMLEAWYELGRY